MASLQLDTNGLCFACGPNNPIGLKLDFHFPTHPGFPTLRTSRTDPTCAII